VFVRWPPPRRPRVGRFAQPPLGLVLLCRGEEGGAHAAQAKAAQIEVPVIIAVVDGGGYLPVIGGAVMGGSAPAVGPDHLNSAASGLSPTTCRARAGHGQNTCSAAGNGSQHVSQRLRHQLAPEIIMIV
jgi:hypothetical protein